MPTEPLNKAYRLLGHSIIALLWILVLAICAETILRVIDWQQQRTALTLRGNLVTMAKPLPKVISHNLPDLPQQFDPNPMDLQQVVTVWKIPWLEYLPNVDIRVQFENNQTKSIQTNIDGYRTGNITKKRANTIRILAIGGSTTFQGLSNETTYPAYLEVLLRKRFPEKNIEVFNLGVSRTQSDLWLYGKRFKKLLSYQPDIVIQYNAINDMAWGYFSDFSNTQPVRKIINKSLLLQKLIPLNITGLEPFFNKTLSNFLLMKKKMRRHSIHYITATFAAPDPASMTREQTALMNTDINEWGRGIPINYYQDYYKIISSYNKQLRGFSKSNHILLIDAAKELSDPNHFVDVCHMNDVGIQLFAETMLSPVSVIISSLPN